MENQVKKAEGEFNLQDMIKLCKRFWEKRRFIMYVVGGFMAFGFIAAICQTPEYTATTVFVPQSSSSKSPTSSSLSSLAAMAGISMGDMTTGASLSPLVYPQMMSNINLNKELMATKIHFKKWDEPISILDYYTDKKYSHFNPLAFIKKYTIGLPGVILGVIKGKPKEVVTLPTESGDTVAVFTQNEYKVYKDVISKAVTLSVDKKEGYITLTVSMPEDVASAELCKAAYDLLGKYITDFKIQYARENNDYIRERYEEAKADYEAKQLALARFNDANRGVMTATAKTRQENLMADYQLAYAIYTEMAKQMLQSDMKVKEDTAVLASVEPVSVPMKKSNSRSKVLIIWTFFGICIAFGGVWGLDWLKNQNITFPKNWKLNWN